MQVHGHRAAVPLLRRHGEVGPRVVVEVEGDPVDDRPLDLAELIHRAPRTSPRPPPPVTPEVEPKTKTKCSPELLPPSFDTL